MANTLIYGRLVNASGDRLHNLTVEVFDDVTRALITKEISLNNGDFSASFDINTHRNIYFEVLENPGTPDETRFTFPGISYTSASLTDPSNRTEVVVNTTPLDFTGATGPAGQSAYVYTGYADDDAGTNFSLTPTSSSKYIQFLHSTTEITAPVAGDFTGTWAKFQGNDSGYEQGALTAIQNTDAGKWVRFAQTPPGDFIDAQGNAEDVHLTVGIDPLRVHNTFALIEKSNVSHQTVIFNAGAFFNERPMVNVIANSGYRYLQASIKKLRIVTGSTYKPMFLEAFVQPTAGFTVNHIGATLLASTGNDWTLIDIEDGYIPGNMTATELNLHLDSPISTTHYLESQMGFKVGGAEVIDSTGAWVGSPTGLQGESAYVYIAYADNASGASFSIMALPSSTHMAVLSSTTPLDGGSAATFSGQWMRFRESTQRTSWHFPR